MLALFVVCSLRCKGVEPNVQCKMENFDAFRITCFEVSIFGGRTELSLWGEKWEGTNMIITVCLIFSAKITFSFSFALLTD